ncbi:MAG: zinc ribbon domain-containing protein [Lentisphaerota bacterium]
MKKSVVAHIAIMVIAVALGSLLASYLMDQQNLISVNRDQISKAPLGGFNKFASDVQWMLFVNYAGGIDCVEKPEAQEIYKRVNDILANDPDLEIAYNIGGMMISNSDPVKSADIFMRGANNPNLKNSWQIPFSAGFVLDRYVTDQDDPDRLKKAEEMFRLAASRAGDNAPYITSALLKVRAKRIAQNGKWSGIPIVNDEHALLCAMFDEWRKGGGSADGNLQPSDSMNIPDLKDRLLRAAQNAKASDPTNKSILETLSKVMKVVSEDQHLCGNCLSPYAAGDKFCGQCGTAVVVFAVCPKCSSVMKGKFCSSCGNTDKSK